MVYPSNGLQSLIPRPSKAASYLSVSRAGPAHFHCESNSETLAKGKGSTGGSEIDRETNVALSIKGTIKQLFHP